jgi:hypothetical protein
MPDLPPSKKKQAREKPQNRSSKCIAELAGAGHIPVENRMHQNRRNEENYRKTSTARGYRCGGSAHQETRRKRLNGLNISGLS